MELRSVVYILRPTLDYRWELERNGGRTLLYRRADQAIRYATWNSAPKPALVIGIRLDGTIGCKLFDPDFEGESVRWGR